MQLYWSLIRAFTRRGTVQNVFNFYFDCNLKDLIENITASILICRKNQFKINYNVGYVFRDIDTKEFDYYYVSNNNLILDSAILILTYEDSPAG